MSVINTIQNYWFGVAVIIVVIALIIVDFIKRKKQTVEDRKREELNNARLAADIKYCGEDKEYVVINAERVDPVEFLNVYQSMEREGYKYDDQLNNFTPFDKILFMRRKVKVVKDAASN